MNRLLFLLLVICAGVSGCNFMDETYCDPKEYEAEITIKEIKRQTANINTPESPEEMLYVEYAFDSEGHAPPPITTISGRFQMKREDIEKKAVKVGDQYSTKATYNGSKNCSPGPFIEGFDKWKKIGE